MKTIGLIGGMSWESTMEYYRVLNEATSEKLGGLHSAKCILYSVDFAEIDELQRADRWQEAAALMVKAGQSLQAVGADFLLICTNTMHKLYDELEARVDLPLLHIADATAAAVKARGIKRVGLLGTRFTMEHDFYRRRLIEKHGLDVLIPDQEDRDLVHNVIYSELCLGLVRPASRTNFIAVIERLVNAGAQGVILGCTEIELLVQEGDCRVPTFPTTRIHAEAAVEYALKDI